MKFFFALPKVWLFTLSGLLVFVLGVIDTVTGQEISFSVFYMLPIYLITWHAGRWPGILVSFLCAAVWLAADYFSGHVVSNSLIPFWNMVVRLTFFLIMTYLLSELQKNEQRRRALERIFFHDILNLLGSVRGFAELLKDKELVATQEVYELMYQATDQSLEEIETQRMLANVENNEIKLVLTRINTFQLVNLLTNLYQHHAVGKSKTIKIAEETKTIEFDSDQTILARILGNMIKNALEHTQPGGEIVIGCQEEQETVCFWVQNAQLIPQQVKPQIFKKTVSSKGEARGLGTYSMRILTDVLNGSLSFTSTPETGTVFKACYPLKFTKDD